jgi:hypothetical protein
MKKGIAINLAIDKTSGMRCFHDVTAIFGFVRVLSNDFNVLVDCDLFIFKDGNDLEYDWGRDADTVIYG